MNPVWLVRSRQLAGKLKFWMALVGYNPRESSWSQVIYLAYVVVFFSLWGFAALTLLADQGAWVLSLFSLSPTLASAWIMAVALFLNASSMGYRAGKKSPFIFGDDDAGLICQTPVDRKQVALAWMLGDWILAVMPFLALAVVLKFAVIQLVEPGGVQWSQLPHYWLAGLRVASLVLLVHLTFTALSYAIGALRLRDDRDQPALRLIPLGFMAIFLGLGLLNRDWREILWWPVLFPLRGGFNGASWIAGFALALILALAGVLALYFSSPRLNLSRAAQESRYRWASQQAIWLGNRRLSQQMQLHQKLGTGHSPSRIPCRAGIWTLLWKMQVTGLRAVHLRQMINWLGVFLTCLGMMLPMDWGAQLWAFILWVLMVGQRSTEPMRGDLELWSMTRQLPFRSREVVLIEIAQPVLLTSLLSWMAIGVSTWAGYPPGPVFIVLLPAAALCIVLAATLDVVRQCRGSDLSAGNVPEMGAVGLLLGAIFAGIPLIWTPLLMRQSSQVWLSSLVGFGGIAISLGFAYGLWMLAAARYRGIK